MLGYYTEEEGEGTKILDGNGNVIVSVNGYADDNGAWIGTSNATLYACYKKQSYDTILKPESDFMIEEWDQNNSGMFCLTDYPIQTGTMELEDTWEALSGSYENDTLISAKFVSTTEGKRTKLHVRFQDDQLLMKKEISIFIAWTKVALF